MPAAGTVPTGFGTGFLVTPRLLLTNEHVLPSRADASGVGANFLHERTSQGLQTGVIFELTPNDFFVSDAALDFALVAVKPRTDSGNELREYGCIPLIEATGKILVGHPINLIQHPAGGPKQYATTQNKLLDVLDEGFLHYTTDTLQGSSGSPAFNQFWEVVGLHHSGVPLVQNGQVIARNGKPWDPESMSDDEVMWVANEAVRVSRIVKYLSQLRLADSSQQGLLNDLLASTADPLRGETSHTVADPQPISIPWSSEMTHTIIHIAGNATIHVNPPVAAAAAPVPVAAVAPALPPAVEKQIRFDKNYSNRRGYSSRFLAGYTIPIPTVTAARAGEILNAADGKPRVLKYHHYSLVMNKKRRLQMWSAVNVDYDPDKKSDRDRKEFGTDTWIYDKRIAGEFQIDDDDFYKPATKIDRGHMVRREDNAWGETELEIEYANSDTFHWTNCTPQHEAFNRERSHGIWGKFETFITDHIGAVDKKASIFAGPVLDNANDPSKNYGEGSVQYPLRFWKVVAAVTRAQGPKKLQVCGFLFDQSGPIDRFGLEAIDFSPFGSFQVSLQRITDLTGVEFPKILRDNDAMAGVQPNERLRIESLDKVRLKRV